MTTLIIDRLDDIADVRLSGIHILDWRIKAAIKKKLPETLNTLITYSEVLPDRLPNNLKKLHAFSVKKVNKPLPEELRELNLPSIEIIDFTLPQSLEILAVPNITELPNNLPPSIVKIYCPLRVAKECKTIHDRVTIVNTA